MNRPLFDCLFNAACLVGTAACAMTLPTPDAAALLGTATAVLLADKLLGVALCLPAVVVFAILTLKGGE